EHGQFSRAVCELELLPDDLHFGKFKGLLLTRTLSFIPRLISGCERHAPHWRSIRGASPVECAPVAVRQSVRRTDNVRFAIDAVTFGRHVSDWRHVRCQLKAAAAQTTPD